MLDPLGPSAPSSTPVTTRETHLAKECPPMRHKTSPLYLNSLNNKRLKLDDYELHSRTDVSPRPPSPSPRLPPLAEWSTEPICGDPSPQRLAFELM
jgi:hypothetical protein